MTKEDKIAELITASLNELHHDGFDELHDLTMDKLINKFTKILGWKVNKQNIKDML